jgi:hypothetical protein
MANKTKSTRHIGDGEHLIHATDEFLEHVIERLSQATAAAVRQRPVFFPNGIELIHVEVSGKISNVDVKVMLKVAGPKGASLEGSNDSRSEVSLHELVSPRLPATQDEAFESIAGVRPDLTDDFCDGIVVRNTPRPENSSGDPAQLLVQLDILDSTTTGNHKRDVQADLKRHGWRIAQKDIVSGPDKSVLQCRQSIQSKAK